MRYEEFLEHTAVRRRVAAAVGSGKAPAWADLDAVLAGFVEAGSTLDGGLLLRAIRARPGGAGSRAGVRFVQDLLARLGERAGEGRADVEARSRIVRGALLEELEAVDDPGPAVRALAALLLADLRIRDGGPEPAGDGRRPGGWGEWALDALLEPDGRGPSLGPGFGARAFSLARRAAEDRGRTAELARALFAAEVRGRTRPPRVAVRLLRDLRRWSTDAAAERGA